METIATDLPTESNDSNQSPRRRVFTAQQRQQLVERYRRSGLKQEEFIAQEGISKASLSKWLQKERQTQQRSQALRFEELNLPALSKPWAVEIVSPDNWTLRLAQLPPLAIWQQLSRALPC